MEKMCLSVLLKAGQRYHIICWQNQHTTEREREFSKLVIFTIFKPCRFPYRLIPIFEVISPQKVMSLLPMYINVEKRKVRNMYVLTNKYKTKIYLLMLFASEILIACLHLNFFMVQRTTFLFSTLIYMGRSDMTFWGDITSNLGEQSI
jgi:hypothetical protein